MRTRTNSSGGACFCLGVRQHNDHSDKRFGKHGDHGLIGQLLGNTGYQLKGKNATLIVYRRPGDGIFFDKAWAEEERAVEFEAGQMTTYLASTEQAASKHGAVNVGELLAPKNFECVFEFTPEQSGNWAQVQPEPHPPASPPP